MSDDMTGESSPLQMPPWQHTIDGDWRRVGVELEMTGLTIDQLAEIVAGYIGGRVDTKGRYERALKGDPAGDWVVELDFDLLKRLGRETRDKSTFAGELGDSAEEVLKWLAETLVPLELVSPPLPLNRLGEIEKIIGMLRSAGAKGTSDRLVNAFGMQFNPEVPSTNPDVLTAYVKAYACLYDWLFLRADINVSRQVTNYVDAYPVDYVRKVVAPDYWPDLSTLIDDYLLDNPTRNRALDLLPLFLHLDQGRVRKVVTDPLVKARPTFHYRLPDCEIHLPQWGLYQAWNDWVQVERLAADRDRLEACCQAYTKYLNQPLERWFGDWSKELEGQWLVR
ncbi:amidoligase family protein [Marinimicrobium sp. ABcell2]|uniref:amidoligase family protein n=1 Tax=Marinimicrobium sp. ABcell2 TaxID=3069751 RepID=UPI0027B55A62|nr:amidoligase family protein [Marinimicrobium sp. ABcell2]MDQ2075935.1 amidoligase family protein [Marinimicrobium sp. ABcell2]